MAGSPIFSVDFTNQKIQPFWTTMYSKSWSWSNQPVLWDFYIMFLFSYPMYNFNPNPESWPYWGSDPLHYKYIVYHNNQLGGVKRGGRGLVGGLYCHILSPSAVKVNLPRIGRYNHDWPSSRNEHWCSQLSRHLWVGRKDPLTSAAWVAWFSEVQGHLWPPAWVDHFS